MLGVIGTGRIGLKVIEIAGGFGMNVLAHDLSPDAEAAARLGFRYDDLDAVLTAADVLTLHVPATPATASHISTWSPAITPMVAANPPATPPLPVQMACLFTHRRHQDPKARLFMEFMIGRITAALSLSGLENAVPVRHRVVR